MQKAKQKKQPASAKRPAQSKYLFPALIVLITFVSLSPTLFNDFVNLDDPQYVVSNPVVQSFSGENLKAIFSQAFVGNYQPQTMLSYLLEYSFFGKGAGTFHFFSLLFHVINTLLVYFIIMKLTKNQVVAFITAILFGIHPLHVESVAWVSARKDVLYTLWFLLSLWFYLAHVKQEGSSKKYYVLAMLCFVFSLLSKAQAVILPVTFFLADYLIGRKLNRKTIIEKVPFFVMALIFGFLAYKIQEKSGAVQDYAYFKPWQRILFSCYGLVNYFYKTLLPIDLSCFYPYPETNDKINTNWVYMAPLILAAVGFVIWKYFRRAKEVLFGMAFFLLTILLVLQLIPVGDAVMADRYTYLSSIGLFFIVGHYFWKWSEKNAANTKTIHGAGFVVLGVLCILSFNRSRLWKDSITLYSHDLQTHPAAIIYNNLGVAYIDEEKLNKANNSTAGKGKDPKFYFEEASKNFTRTVELKPRFPSGYKNKALTHELLGENDKAVEAFNMAVTYFPNDENNYLFRGKVLLKMGRNEDALADLSKVITMNAANPDAYYARAQVYGNLGKLQNSLDDMNKVLELKPGLPEGYGNRGIVLSMMGRFQEAIKDFDESLRLNPAATNTYMNRSLAWKGLGNIQAALQDALTAKAKGNPVDEAYLQQLQTLAAQNK